MPKARDCIWAIHDADFKSPIGEMAQISALIALEAEKIERRLDGQIVAVQVNLATPSYDLSKTYMRPSGRMSFSGIQWRNL